MTPQLLAIDPGAGAIKLYADFGFAELPSIIAIDGAAAVSSLAGLATSKRPTRITTPGGSFLVGPTAHEWGRPVENLDPDRFTGAPEMEALLCAALNTHVVAGIGEKINVIVGLPLDTLTGDEAAGNAAAVKKWLEGPHSWTDGFQSGSVVINSVKVASQPIGAMMDWLLDDAGHYIPERKALAGKEIGILSVGMNTIEMLAVHNMQIQQRFTAGRTMGVRRLLEILNPNDLYSRGEMDAQLRSGTLEGVDRALPIWSSEVSDTINKRWGNAWQRFAVVIVVGGGSLLLQDMLSRKFQGRAWFPDMPVLATARGLLKFGHRK
jgi:hypothetical protein